MFKPVKRIGWEDGYIDYPGKGIIKDIDVYHFMTKHMSLLDWLNPKKVVACALLAQTILMGVVEIPKDEKWVF